MDAEWISKNPATLLKAPKPDAPPTLPFTLEEVDASIDACDRFRGNGARMRALILVMRYSGLRISDPATLKRDRISDGRIVVYQQKTGTDRKSTRLNSSH